MSRSWTRFERVEDPSPPPDVSQEVRAQWLEYAKDGWIEVWENNIYLVIIYRGELVPCAPNLRTQAPVWLSIRRIQRGKLPRDWRDLQRIKNEILGADFELVELFPNEERLVDESDQTHLWGFELPGLKFPFGYAERSVSGPEVAEFCGATQRAFEFGTEDDSWITPPARERPPLGEEDTTFVLDMLRYGPQVDADHRRVANLLKEHGYDDRE